MLSKEECLFERDEEGELIGKKVTLKLLDEKTEVIVKPLPRGRLMSIFQTAKDGTQEEQIKADSEVIEFGLVEPKLTKEEIEVLKPKYAGALATAILSVSLGVDQEEVGKNAEKVIQEESELKKK